MGEAPGDGVTKVMTLKRAAVLLDTRGFDECPDAASSRRKRRPFCNPGLICWR